MVTIPDDPEEAWEMMCNYEPPIANMVFWMFLLIVAIILFHVHF